MRVGRNTGVGFSLIAGHSWIAFVISLALLCVVGSCAVRSVPVAASVVLGLLLGGGLSNEVDRVARGRVGVVDFLTLPHWPTFNLADTAITIGVVGMVILLALRRPIIAPGRR
jgi:signal peptidase II